MKHKQPIAWGLMTVVVTLILTGIMVIRWDILANSVMWLGDAILFFWLLPLAVITCYIWLRSTLHRWTRRNLRRRPKPIPISYGRKKMERERRRKSG